MVSFPASRLGKKGQEIKFSSNSSSVDAYMIPRLYLARGAAHTSSLPALAAICNQPAADGVAVTLPAVTVVGVSATPVHSQNINICCRCTNWLALGALLPQQYTVLCSSHVQPGATRIRTPCGLSRFRTACLMLLHCMAMSACLGNQLKQRCSRLPLEESPAATA